MLLRNLCTRHLVLSQGAKGHSGYALVSVLTNWHFRFQEAEYAEYSACQRVHESEKGPEDDHLVLVCYQ